MPPSVNSRWPLVGCGSKLDSLELAARDNLDAREEI